MVSIRKKIETFLKENIPDKASAGAACTGLVACAALTQLYRVNHPTRLMITGRKALPTMILFSALDITMGSLKAKQLTQIALGSSAACLGLVLYSVYGSKK